MTAPHLAGEYSLPRYCGCSVSGRLPAWWKVYTSAKMRVMRYLWVVQEKHHFNTPEYNINHRGRVTAADLIWRR